MPTTPARILVIEDEADIAEVLRLNLTAEGYAVVLAADGPGGLASARELSPDLVLLDLMLPGLSGLEVCRQLRADAGTAHMPIVMVTARGRESDVVLGLGLGADDYITKPFRIAELQARVQAQLRRGSRVQAAPDTALQCGTLRLDSLAHQVAIAGMPVELTATEFRLLETLMGSPGRVFTRELLIDLAIGSDVLVGERTIDTHVGTLRRKLGDLRDSIRTIWGVGYRFEPPAEPAAVAD
jgi:two-component system phosphate regulon response regulator PhoB